MADSPPSRKPRLEAAEAPDLLSRLPLEVLDNILSRLHIHAVVRTSALSRAWRCRWDWESLPSVNLVRSPDIRAADVDAILLRRSAPIRTFRLGAYHDNWYVDALHDWLIYLSRNGVRNLFLWFPRFNFQLHSSLFSCRDLTSLHLTSCRLPPAPPGFNGFPSLKTLQLFKVAIPEHGGRQLAALIAASPLIEKVDLLMVKLMGDNPDDEWVIRGPNLRELTIVGEFVYGGRTEELPLLQVGVLVGCNYAKFLMGMARITKLEFFCLSNWSTEVDVLDRLPFLFNNLKNLVIALNFTKTSEILSVFCLLRSAPALEELDVWGWSQGKQEIDADDDFLNAQCAGGMFGKLHVVRMKRIMCLYNEFQFMEFILSKAKVLQVLSVRLGSDALCSNEEAVTYIAEYPRASPDAQVIFLGREPAKTTPTENAEVEESQTADCGRDSIDTETGNNAEVEEVQMTDSGHESINTNAGNNAEVEGARTTGSRSGSISSSIVNAEVEETKTIFIRRGSIYMPPVNAEVDDSQARSSQPTNTSTENDFVEETQATGSSLVDNVHPRRRHRLDLKSVAQLEQLEEEKLELQKLLQLELANRRKHLELNVQEHNSLIEHEKFMRSNLQDLSTRLNMSLPPFPPWPAHLATPRLGNTSADPDIEGDGSAHIADSPEDHCVNSAANAHTDCQEDNAVNGASNAHAESSEKLS